MHKAIVLAALIIPFSLTGSGCSGGSGGTGPGDNVPVQGEFVVLAWNDLGMHCLNPTYDKLVVLPPYNTVLAQVIKRGAPPEVVTAGVTVSYRLDNNTYSYGKASYGQFWDHAVALFGSIFGFTSLAHDVGLKHNGLSGQMAVSGNHFVVEGIPVVPINDANTHSPFQVAIITVKDGQGKVLAETRATVPTSDEMNCAKCHGGASAFDDILARHDAANGTTLAGSTPVLCAGCHGAPALGLTDPGSSGEYLSEAMHKFHADKGAACYDCHPGAMTKCSRSLRHTAPDGNCTTCHGDMANVAATIGAGRVPWATEPFCATCHTGVDGVATGTALYRNSAGHGNLYCAACHGSPHAMIPTSVASDNYQALQYQGSSGPVKSIGSCGVCHSSSRGGGDIGEFAGTHGGSSPEHKTACHVCHTQVTTDTALWPHAYDWKNSGQ
jgi:hypothetical protein